MNLWFADIDGADHLGELLAAFESWWVVRYPNGSPTLSGRGLERSSPVGRSAPPGDPRNATVEVRIEPDGRVARADVRFEATVVEVRRDVAVGTTATDRPPWYGAVVGTVVANATGSPGPRPERPGV